CVFRHTHANMVQLALPEPVHGETAPADLAADFAERVELTLGVSFNAEDADAVGVGYPFDLDGSRFCLHFRHDAILIVFRWDRHPACNSEWWPQRSGGHHQNRKGFSRPLASLVTEKEKTGKMPVPRTTSVRRRHSHLESTSPSLRLPRHAIHQDARDRQRLRL